MAAEPEQGVPYRRLGRTGEKVSAIAWAVIISAYEGGAGAIRIIRSAIDRGINFMDNCWDYHNGAARCGWARRCRTATARGCFS